MKTTRRIMALVLALALIVVMAIPAFASTYEKEAEYVYNGTSYTYNCKTTSTSTVGRAEMTYEYASVSLRCALEATVHYDGIYYINTGSSSGRSSISASADNYVIANGVAVYGSITYTAAEYYIGSAKIHNKTVTT